MTFTLDGTVQPPVALDAAGTARQDARFTNSGPPTVTAAYCPAADLAFVSSEATDGCGCACMPQPAQLILTLRRFACTAVPQATGHASVIAGATWVELGGVSRRRGLHVISIRAENASGVAHRLDHATARAQTPTRHPAPRDGQPEPDLELPLPPHERSPDRLR